MTAQITVRLKKSIFPILLLLFPGSIFSQIGVEGPDHVCLGDLANFKLKNTSGKTISKFDWNLGDGHVSVLATPSSLYNQTGTYTVSCNVTFSDNSTGSASKTINVLSLPTAIFNAATTASPLCQYRAHACYDNNSKAAEASRPLQKMIVTWGDGNLDVEKNKTLSTRVCHDYDVTGDFKIRFEIVDSKGCKSQDYKIIQVVPGVKAEISRNISTGCTKTTYCAELKTEPAGANVIWWVNGTKMASNATKFCNDYYQEDKLSFKAIAFNPSNFCSDTVQFEDSIHITPDKLKLQFSSKNICYGDETATFTNATPGAEKVQWFIDNTLISGKNENTLLFRAKEHFIFPGKYVVKCVAWYGPCKLEATDTIRIRGPRAKLGVWNNLQCNTNYKVFFTDSSEYTSNHCSWQWTSADNASGTCTIWRAKNQNRYKNCWYTLDNWGKHQFPDPFRGTINLRVYDSISGCSDDTAISVKIGNCSECFKINYYEICQGDTFLNVGYNYFNPRYFSLDTGKTWLPFPSKIDHKYKGLYGVTFIVPRNFPNYAEDFGDDSFRIVTVPVIYDTIFKPAFLRVNERPELQSVKVSATGCDQCRIKLSFDKHLFKADENLFITWKKKTWMHFISQDTIIDTLIIQADKKGGDILSIRYFNASGCESVYHLWAGCGLELELEQDHHFCKDDIHCIELKARDPAKDNYYNMQYAGLKYTFWWNKTRYLNTPQICNKIDSFGTIHYLYTATDAQGCTDTLRDSTRAQKVIAGVTPDSKLAFCSELKQLFDASIVLGGDAEISSYGWNFNNRNRNSALKDPVQLFEKGGKNHIKHWVNSTMGCTDTIEYDIEIAGSDPYFTIPDTLGCAPFKAKFINLSKNCKTYIWEFGDLNNNIASKSDNSETEFTYTDPGIYHIRLTGIDTIYSPVTGEAYHCHSYFPDQSDTVRRVRVLPFYQSALTGPDSVCENEKFYITSSTIAKAGFDIWEYPDGMRIRRFAGATIYQQKAAGTYVYKLKPDYGQNPGEPYCADTSKITVHVVGVNADFDFNAPKNDGYYYFTNKSTDAVGYLWNFGHPGSGSKNSSTLKNPEHDYYPDTGIFKVCLVAKNSLGCKDTICKQVPQKYMEYLMLANVFTPDDVEGKNDLYDVVIEGENKYELKIFNRWGELVYRSDKDGDRFTDGLNWNGKVHNTGALCPAGSYFYQFTYSFNRHPDKVKTITGNITLLR